LVNSVAGYTALPQRGCSTICNSKAQNRRTAQAYAKSTFTDFDLETQSQGASEVVECTPHHQSALQHVDLQKQVVKWLGAHLAAAGVLRLEVEQD
jgi:hypothetical protein